MKRKGHLFVLVLVVLFTAAGTALADFDLTNRDDVVALNHELLDDPIGMGYDPEFNFSLLCKLISDPEGNVGGEVGPVELTPEVVLKAMSFRDYRLATKDGQAYIDLLVGGGIGNLDPYREKLLEALPKNRETEFPLRRLSRAEVLFGQGTSVNDGDVQTALAGPRDRQRPRSAHGAARIAPVHAGGGHHAIRAAVAAATRSVRHHPSPGLLL